MSEPFPQAERQRIGDGHNGDKPQVRAALKEQGPRLVSQHEEYRIAASDNRAAGKRNDAGAVDGDKTAGVDVRPHRLPP